MDDNSFQEYKERVKHRVDMHENLINNHSERIDKLEQYKAGNDEKIKALIEKMDGLITTIRWGCGIFLGGIVSFFFYAIERGVFK